jgi:hypothetical protein
MRRIALNSNETVDEDAEGHVWYAGNATEAVDRDTGEDVDGHGVQANANEPVDEDADTEGHGVQTNANEPVDEDADE